MSDSTPSPSAVSAPTPEEPAASAASAASADEGRGAAPRRRRRAWKIGLISVLAVVLVLVLGVGALGLWLRHSLGSKIETIDDPFAAISTRAPQQSVGANQKPATNILLLGSDSRISAGDPSQWEAGAQRTDAIMIVQVSGDRQEVSVVSIPRDTWVEVPGYGQAKINAAYSYGGPSLTIQTVEQLTGVRIDHFVIADFESFEALTDEIGGVVINLKTPQTLADTQFPAGAQRLNGAQALAYTRERKSLPGGDFDRINRQQAWMRAIVSQVLHGGILTDPTKLYGFLSAVTQTMAVDEGFTIDEMQSLAIDLRGLRSRNINFLTIPTAGTGTSEDGQSIVVRDEAADTPLYTALATDTVQEYLETHPDAVPRLPGTAN
ncbi:MAG: LCP family protein [Actinomyces dentalis]